MSCFMRVLVFLTRRALGEVEGYEQRTRRGRSKRHNIQGVQKSKLNSVVFLP